MILYGPTTKITPRPMSPEDVCACGHSRYAHEQDDQPTFRPRLGPCDPCREVAPLIDVDSPCACVRFRPIRSHRGPSSRT